MALLVPPPEQQFVDANGVPYAGGTIQTYVPGTTTPKSTWQDEGATVLNTNPIVLDAAGRAIIYGDGQYRFILKDVNGLLIYDQLTDSVISDAMLPVVQAATIADAVTLLGITGSIQAETNRATAAEGTLQNNINAETTRATNSENSITSALNSEVTRAKAAEANLQSQVNTITGSGGILPTGYSIRFGEVTSASGSGAFSGVFSPPFPTSCDSIVASAGLQSWWACITSISAGGFSGITSSPLSGGSWVGGPVPVAFIAIGH